MGGCCSKDATPLQETNTEPKPTPTQRSSSVNSTETKTETPPPSSANEIQVDIEVSTYSSQKRSYGTLSKVKESPQLNDETTGTLSKASKTPNTLSKGIAKVEGDSASKGTFSKGTFSKGTFSKGSKLNFGGTISKGSKLNFNTFSKSSKLETFQDTTDSTPPPPSKPQKEKKERKPKKEKTPKVKREKLKTPKLDRPGTYSGPTIHGSLGKKFRNGLKSGKKHNFGECFTSEKNGIISSINAHDDMKILGFSGRQMDTGDLVISKDQIQDYCLKDWGKSPSFREADSNVPNSIGETSGKKMAVAFRDDTAIDSPYSIKRNKSDLREMFNAPERSSNEPDEGPRDRNLSFTHGVTPLKFEQGGSGRLPHSYVSPLRSLGRKNTIQSKREGNKTRHRPKLSLDLFEDPSQAEEISETHEKVEEVPEIKRHIAAREQMEREMQEEAERERQEERKYATQVQPVREGENVTIKTSVRTPESPEDSKSQSNASSDISTSVSEIGPGSMPYENPQFCDVDLTQKGRKSGSSSDSDSQDYIVASRRGSKTAQDLELRKKDDKRRDTTSKLHDQTDATNHHLQKGPQPFSKGRAEPPYPLKTQRSIVLDPHDSDFERDQNSSRQQHAVSYHSDSGNDTLARSRPRRNNKTKTQRTLSPCASDSSNEHSRSLNVDQNETDQHGVRKMTLCTSPYAHTRHVCKCYKAFNKQRKDERREREGSRGSISSHKSGDSTGSDGSQNSGWDKRSVDLHRVELSKHDHRASPLARS